MPTLPWGALGVSLVARELRRTFWTLSAWRDEAALSAAFEAEPHRHLIEHFKPRMAGSSFVTWTAPATALPISWEEALRRLEKPDTVHGHSLRGAHGLAPIRSRDRAERSLPARSG
jgi:hypothetical protein